MTGRLLQIVLAVGDCLLGLLLLAMYGPALLHAHGWPPTIGQEVLVLVAGSVLPLALLATRFPVIAGLAQFSAAFIGNQLLHEAPLRVLREFSRVSMGMALAILFLAVLRGILEVTREAFGEADEPDEDRLMRAA